MSKHPQLIDRVNLRRWATEARLRPKARAVYRLSACGPLALSLGARLAAGLERFDRRRSWWRLARQLMVVAYVLGVRDALPTESSLNRFLRHTGGAKAPTIIPIELGSASRVTIPEAGGEVDLEICCDGRVLAHVAAQRPGLEWNWRDLIERATAAVAGALGPIPIAQARNVAAGGSDAEAAVEDADSSITVVIPTVGRARKPTPLLAKRPGLQSGAGEILVIDQSGARISARGRTLRRITGSDGRRRCLRVIARRTTSACGLPVEPVAFTHDDCTVSRGLDRRRAELMSDVRAIYTGLVLPARGEAWRDSLDHR